MWILIALVIVILIYLFLISPTMRKHPDTALFNNLYVAHRGLHDISKGVPENSIKSFYAAMEHGFAIEIDLHLTKDGKVVIFHDDSLKRVCGKDAIIETQTFEELSKLYLLNTKEKIPLLEDLLKICKKETVLVIEYKCTPKNYKALCIAANEILNKYNTKYIVQSFNPLAIGWFKKNRPDLCRGQLSTNFLKRGSKNLLEIICGFMILNFFSRPDFISFEAKYSSSIPRRICEKLGALSACWTLKSKDELDKYKNLYSVYIFEDFIPKT